ncbi:MAG: hypothetical protein ACFE8B_10080 [Candidatus Hermodarchaeota archaeon]
MVITQERFEKGLNSLIGRFSRDIKKIYYALIFQVLFFLVVISLTTFTSINQEQILWVASIIGIAGIGITADFDHLKKALEDGFNDLKSLKRIRKILGAIPEMLVLSETPDEDRKKFAVLLRKTLKKALLTSDPASLMQEVTDVLE